MIKITNSLNDLSINRYLFNVFFSENYATFERMTGNQYVFLYSESFMIPVRISSRSVFKYAHFTTEPVVIGVSNNGDLKSFLNEACNYLRTTMKVQWINMNDAASLFMDYPDGSIHIPFGSHVIDLSLTEEDLWKNVHSKHRNVIKKAEKDGIKIECGVTEKLIADYHQIDVETWERSNKGAKGEDTLSQMIRALGDNAVIYMAYKDDEPQSGAIFYYNQTMCYYMFGANKNNPSTGSGNLLQWRAILDMKNMGVQKYSFVGCRINEDENSKYHGIQRFKERFGGALVQGCLFKIVFNKPLYNLFNIIVALKGFKTNKGLKFPKDIIDQEIHKWK